MNEYYHNSTSAA
jgi:hypothetical protein